MFGHQQDLVAGLLFAVAVLAPQAVIASEADVINVKVTAEPSGTFNFDVTVTHADAGWEHYADKWEVTGPDGNVFATRILAHPHDDEQPFTRSQGGISIPERLATVTIRAHDLVHGYGGKEMQVKLPDR